MRNISRRGFLDDQRRRARRTAADSIDRRARASHQPGLPPRRGERRSAGRSRHPVDARDAAQPATGAERVSGWSRATRSWRTSSRAARSQTGAARDFTVKIDATGLEPATTYYYRFEASGEQSPIGRTRTLPRPTSSRVRLGVVSCSNLPLGYFNAYACLADARRSRCRAAPRRLHLRVRQRADTATAPRSGASRRRTRRSSRCRTTASGTRSTRPIPIRRTIHRQHPFIVRLGRSRVRQQHLERRRAESQRRQTKATGRRGAPRRVQAYFEWMPIREDAPTLKSAIYRTFRFGDLADADHARHAPRRPRRASRRATTSRAIESRDAVSCSAPTQEGWLAEQFATSVRNKRTLDRCSDSR